MIREICKAGWLQQKVEKRTGAPIWSKKYIFLPEKWYVLCIHDDRSPFLEIYPNDEVASRHEPAEAMNLKECQYITTAIEDDRTFIIAFHDQGGSLLELAALSALERQEWMEMLRFKLTRLGCLEPGSNLYSPFPCSSAAFSSSVSAISSTSESIVSSSPSTAVSVESNFAQRSQSPVVEGAAPIARDDMAPPVSRLPYDELLYEPIAHVPRSTTNSPSQLAERHRDEPETPSALGYSAINRQEKPLLPPRNVQGRIGPTHMDITRRRQTSQSSEGEASSVLYDLPRALLPPLAAASSPPRSPSVSSSSSRANVERYDPLPWDEETTIRFTSSGNPSTTRVTDSSVSSIDSVVAAGPKHRDGSNIQTPQSFDNPGFDDDEDPRRRYANGPLASSSSVHSNESRDRGPYSSISGRSRMVPWSVLNGETSTRNTEVTRANSVSPSTFTQASGRNRSQSVTTESMSSINGSKPGMDHYETSSAHASRTPSPPTLPPPAPPLPLPNQLSIPVGSDRVMPLKETEVERLRSLMESPLLVKATMLLQHVVNENGQLMGLALADLIGFVWVAGWLKRLTKQFSAGWHVGDRIDSVLDADGKAVAINSTSKLEEVLKECWRRRCQCVTLFLKRLPLGQVYVLKRAVNGDIVGITLKTGKNEILAIEEGRAAHKAGMRAQCQGALNNSVSVNYFITEINGRPLNMFAKEHEAQKRLNAVGTELTVLVQPSDFIKELRKKLKGKKNHKDYIVG